ncbi:dienelactone hydrolase [Nocardioides humilatus]|uniref:Dienelactone hydrolase n=1 Tax=Nocardioides humilatus TaxID=2607660 RepID=A0A5B1L7F5_9ACTN|nr:dienelactone hydrolase family protein [Nocardioides humilatus]KAA1416414.1 dienelactone hydrolase [Nocardioides humilatus]
MPTELLDSWTKAEHTADDLEGQPLTFPTYRKGSGPGVIVIHEVPGMTPQFIAFAEEVVAAGFTVVLPHLFGTPGAPIGAVNVPTVISKLCVSREFVTLATRQTSPVSGWLRSLARELHSDVGGPGVGAIGMCFTGGFALGMMVDDAIAAPVLCQPSVPFAVTPGRGRDLGLSPADLDVVKRRAAGGCQVLGLQYKGDPMTGSRFDTLDRELGEAFIRVDFPGYKHSTVTLHRQQEGVDRVLAFLREKLAG